MQHRSEIAMLLERLQAESLNQGGFFDWLEIPNPDGLAVYDCLFRQLENLENKRREQLDTRTQRHKYKPNDDYKKLKINPWTGGWEAVWERTMLWSDSKSLFHKHQELTPAFWPLFEAFKTMVMETVTAAGLIAMHSIEDNYAMKALVFDHCSDDIVFETRNGLFLLHLGISS